jgi:hypothetical protein
MLHDSSEVGRGHITLDLDEVLCSELHDCVG